MAKATSKNLKPPKLSKKKVDESVAILQALTHIVKVQAETAMSMHQRLKAIEQALLDLKMEVNTKWEK